MPFSIQFLIVKDEKSRLAAREAGVKRAVTVDNPSIGFTEHQLNDSVLLVVAINYEPSEVVGKLTVKGRVGKVYRGSVENGTIRMGPNDVAVFEMQ